MKQTGDKGFRFSLLSLIAATTIPAMAGAYDLSAHGGLGGAPSSQPGRTIVSPSAVSRRVDSFLRQKMKVSSIYVSRVFNAIRSAKDHDKHEELQNVARMLVKRIPEEERTGVELALRKHREETDPDAKILLSTMQAQLNAERATASIASGNVHINDSGPHGKTRLDFQMEIAKRGFADQQTCNRFCRDQALGDHAPCLDACHGDTRNPVSLRGMHR